MQRLTSDCANQVGKIFDTTISELKECNDAPIGLVNEIEALRDQIRETLSRTLEQEESLRSDIIKYNCEWKTNSEEVSKLTKKLNSLRREREERRLELEQELEELKRNFHAKKNELNDKLELEEKIVENELNEYAERSQKHFEKLVAERDVLLKRREEKKQEYVEQENCIKASIDSLSSEIQQLSREFEAELKIKEDEIKEMQLRIEKKKSRRKELEEHFQEVDKNNFEKQQEENALKAVRELEKKAMALLDNGATQMQKLYRGVRDRKLVEKMKAKSKKKGGKKKGKGRKAPKAKKK